MNAPQGKLLFGQQGMPEDKNLSLLFCLLQKGRSVDMPDFHHIISRDKIHFPHLSQIPE